MDELLKDFLTETTEHIEGAETQLVHFERNPSDASLISSIFRLVHTIKGTSSFLGLERLERVGHAAESVMGMLRDGVPPTQHSVTIILAAIDRIKTIIEEIGQHGAEPPGDDSEIINALEAYYAAGTQAAAAAAVPPAIAGRGDVRRGPFPPARRKEHCVRGPVPCNPGAAALFRHRSSQSFRRDGVLHDPSESDTGNLRRGNGMRLFALNGSEELGEAAARALGISLDPHEERDFEDGEHKARPLASVRGRDVYVLHSLAGDTAASANDRLCRLLFFVAACRDNGAARELDHGHSWEGVCSGCSSEGRRGQACRD